MKQIKAIFFLTALLLLPALGFAALSITTESRVLMFPSSQVKGSGPLPYNYRVIDDHIHAGGHPLNPATKFNNSDEQAQKILGYLKPKGVKTIIDLENTLWIQWRYSELLKKSGVKRIHIPMHYNKTPNKNEWERIKAAMKEPVYIHCKWGADRTGAVIAKYLVEEKGYKPYDAWKAVISKGSHAGPLGGLKQDRSYRNLVLFFWPDAESNAEFRRIYN